ncbi:MAG: hypothetical protein HYY43_00070 [Deltaproteobacteria bacterium]|nr:hypothetical protein [Deltaproteobacteria bacterium]MBI2973984.1 hypothetical protein [Deltaproteobacteria bacterium]
MQRGISIIGAVFTLLILGIFGAAMVSIVTTDQEVRRRQVEKEQAFYEVQAGLEYATREIKKGGYPIVTNKQLAKGAFTTTIDYPTHVIFSTGTAGDVSKTHQITNNQMGADCITITYDSASLAPPAYTDLRGIMLRKMCNDAVTIDKIQLTWVADGGEKVTRIEIESNAVYDNLAGSISGGIVDIADYSLTSVDYYQINLIRFTGNVSNKQLTMVLYMTDSSYKAVTFNML